MTMRKRIFQEVPDGLDESSTSHGALFGGMASIPNNFELAKTFRQAADSLIARHTKEREAYEVLFPVLHLYYHAIELYLKAAIQDKHPSFNIKTLGHNITKACNLLAKQKGHALPAQAVAYILEIRQKFKDAEAFRYSDGFQEGEYWVDFKNLKESMDWLFLCFEKIPSKGK